jgi:uncharacterized OB-fold protein
MSLSQAATALAERAKEGRFALQCCDACGAAQYPPRDVCQACLGAALVWRDVADGGVVLAETTIRVGTDPWFQSRPPARVGLVALTCGPSAVAFLDDGVSAGQTVRLRLRQDHEGRAVMVASTPN